MKVFSALLCCLVAGVGFTNAGTKQIFQDFNSLSSNPNDGRIIGGDLADIEDFRFQLAVRYFGSFICGASAISDTWALWAAHCQISNTPSAFTILGGVSDRTDDINGILFNVLELFSHSQYDSDTLDNDVALLRTEGLLTTSNGLILPIAIVSEGPLLPVNSSVTVSGWGQNSFPGSGAVIDLLYVRVYIDDLEECRIAHDTLNAVTENMLCASAPGRDACFGDSGGPLTYLDGDDLVQVGIVSTGEDCADARWPGIYTDISTESVRGFIREISGI